MSHEADWIKVNRGFDLGVQNTGLTQPQVTRRVSALLTDLLDDLPAAKHEPLPRHQRRLSARMGGVL